VTCYTRQSKFYQSNEEPTKPTSKLSKEMKRFDGYFKLKVTQSYQQISKELSKMDTVSDPADNDQIVIRESALMMISMQSLSAREKHGNPTTNIKDL
jgi:hypothetical protein